MFSHIKICSIDEEGSFGGPQRRIIETAKALKKHNIETHVVYPICDSEKYSRELLGAQITNTSLDITRLTKEKKVLVRYIFTFPLEVLRLYLFLKKHEFNLIQVNGTPHYKGALAAKIAKIPVVWVMEDTQMPFIIKKTTVFFARLFATGIIVTGKRVYDYYIRGSVLENKPCVEIPAPVNINIFDPKNVVANKIMTHMRGRKIITVSGLIPVKGLEYFIEMASGLLQNYNDLLFFVAGTKLDSQKKYFNYIKSLIDFKKLPNDKFIFCGMVDDIPSFLQAADIFVCTSVSEAGPMTVWEAMSMAKAVVTTDVGSVRQYIEDGVSGFIVPVMDSKSLMAKVEELLNNPDLARRMGIKARLTAKENLDVSVVADKYASFYKSVLIA